MDKGNIILLILFRNLRDRKQAQEDEELRNKAANFLLS